MANEIYNTTWWGTALDTARTAGTDPDFFGSQMKLLTSEQDDLVTNGDFSTDSDWIKGTGWSIETNLARSIQTTSNNYLQQTLSNLKNNNRYIITFDLDIISAVTTTIGISNTGAFGNLSGSERFFTTSGTKTLNGVYSNSFPNYIRFVSGIGTEFTITNISIQLVRADEVEAKKCVADWIHRTALQDLNN